MTSQQYLATVQPGKNYSGGEFGNPASLFFSIETAAWVLDKVAIVKNRSAATLREVAAQFSSSLTLSA
jgi:hypothetical protein